MLVEMVFVTSEKNATMVTQIRMMVALRRAQLKLILCAAVAIQHIRRPMFAPMVLITFI